MTTAALITAAPTTAVSLTETKRHLRIELTDTNDDTYLTRLIKVAEAQAEGFTRRVLVQQTWDEWFDGFPAGNFFELSKAPLLSVTSVSYTDYAESSTSMTVSTDYIVDSDSEPGRIVLAYGKSWPSYTPSAKNPVKVRYVAGYEAESGDYRVNIPETIRQAILLMVGHLYNNREATIPGISLVETPMGFESLLWPYRIMTL